MKGIKIIGMGRAVPDGILTNEELAGMLGVTPEWIESRTGINKRHRLNPEKGESVTGLASGAAQKAIEAAGIDKNEIAAVIVATVSGDYSVPATACMVQEALGLPGEHMLCFDLNAACTGFVYALSVMESILACADRRYGLVIGAEGLSRITDMTDKGTSILFGDGAGAAVVEARESWPPLYADAGCSGNDSSLYVPGIGAAEPGFIHMDGTGVFKFAVRTLPRCIDNVLQKSGLKADDIDYFVFHQSNARITDTVVKKYGIPEEKYYKNLDEYGNTSAASIPIVLSELYDAGKLHDGSLAMVAGYGGGLTWGGALIGFAAAG